MQQSRSREQSRPSGTKRPYMMSLATQHYYDDTKRDKANNKMLSYAEHQDDVSESSSSTSTSSSTPVTSALMDLECWCRSRTGHKSLHARCPIMRRRRPSALHTHNVEVVALFVVEADNKVIEEVEATTLTRTRLCWVRVQQQRRPRRRQPRSVVHHQLRQRWPR